MRKVQFLIKRVFVMLITTTLIVITGCQKYTPEPTSTPSLTDNPEITSFMLSTDDNPQLKGDISGEIGKDNQIVIIIDYAVSDLMFKPSIKYTEGATISPDPSEKIDATKKTKFTVSDNDKSTEYEVVFYIDGETKLLSLNVNGTPTYYNEKTEVYHVVIDQSKWGKAFVFEPVGISIKTFTVDGQTVISGESVSLNLDFGKEYDLKISGDDSSETVKIVLSGIPIVSIEADFDASDAPEKGFERGATSVSVYDPTEDGKFSVLKQYAGIRFRGGFSSQLYDKRPYTIEFQDKGTLEEVGVPLFGLRNDGDWILDAIATDIARVRNRISTDIWIDLHTLSYIGSEPNARTATRGRMVELYFNDKYRGIYCVTERVDRKQLNLDIDNGYLYKAEGWDNFITFEGYDSYLLPKDGDERWGDEEGYQAEYPDKPATKWEPLVNMVKFVCDSDDNTLKAGIDNYFNIDNLVDYFIYINVIGAADNASKNTYLAIYNDISATSGDSQFFYSPWDLDCTFGRDWGTNKLSSGFVIGVKHDRSAGDGEHLNYLMNRLAKTNGGGFGDKVKARWAEVKGNVCSHAAIMKRFDDYQKLLEDSGAYEREMDQWSGAKSLGGEIKYIDGWLEDQISTFDSYIQNWDTNISKL